MTPDEARKYLKILIEKKVKKVEKKNELIRLVNNNDIPPVRGILHEIHEINSSFTESEEKIAKELIFYFG